MKPFKICYLLFDKLGSIITTKLQTFFWAVGFARASTNHCTANLMGKADTIGNQPKPSYI